MIKSLIYYYLKNNLVQGLKTFPSRVPPFIYFVIIAYAIIAIILGLKGGILDFAPFQNLTNQEICFAPFVMLIFPSLTEELFFRGILIPYNTNRYPLTKQLWIILFSTFSFVLWHPLNAYLWNPASLVLFTDPIFLSIVTILGICCVITYIHTQSIYFPILIHWLTIVSWVLLFGGRNLLLGIP